MSKLRTLTVPDFLWLNQELTKSRQKYSFATLEEGVFYQYSYGSSKNVVEQAARLLTGFAKLNPFEKGSSATALAGTIAFLKMNELDLKLEPTSAKAWAESIWSNPSTAASAISGLVEEFHLHTHHGTAPSREILGEVLAAYSDALEALIQSEPERPLAVR
jgi:prophage maintenance system killer protein